MSQALTQVGGISFSLSGVCLGRSPNESEGQSLNRRNLLVLEITLGRNVSAA